MNLRTTSILVAAIAAASLLAGCKDGDNDGVFFNVNTADAGAHAAMVQPADLPGRGWEIVATDEGDDDDDGSNDFMTMAAREPACSQITSLASLSGIGGIFGGSDDDEDPAGWAQIELQRTAGAGAFIPVSLEAEIEIKRTVTDVQGAWQVVKNLLESDQTKTCLARVINSQFSTEMASTGMQLTFEPRTATARSPHGGAAMAFAMSIRLPGVISVDALMEMHLWPYGNGQVSVFILGPKEELTPALIGDLLKAVDNKIIAAEKAN